MRLHMKYVSFSWWSCKKKTESIRIDAAEVIVIKTFPVLMKYRGFWTPSLPKHTSSSLPVPIIMQILQIRGPQAPFFFFTFDKAPPEPGDITQLFLQAE